MTNIGSNKPTAFLDNVFTIKHFFERNEGTAFLFAVSSSFHLRRQVNETVINYSADRGKHIGVIELDLKVETGLLTQLQMAKKNFPHGLLFNNLDNLIDSTQGEFAYDFNQMREALIALSIPLFIWLRQESHDIFTHKAIDTYLRRDLSTLFFNDPEEVNDPLFIDRFSEKIKESKEFEDTRTRIALLEKQISEAKEDEFSKIRLANEVALPLAQAYVENYMITEAKTLIKEFAPHFDHNKPHADKVIATLYEKTGDFKKAIEYYKNALEKDIKLFGQENFIVANDYTKLGDNYHDNFNYDKAIIYYKKALENKLKLFGEESGAVADAYNDLGMSLKLKSNYNEAIKYFTKALKIGSKLFAESHTDVAAYNNNLGATYESKGDLDKAIFYYEKALEIDLKLFGELDFHIAIRYNNLGTGWQAKGDLDKAVDYFQRALNIALKIYGEENSNVAIYYLNLGKALFHKNDLDKAISLIEKSYDIFLNLHGSGHPETILAKKIFDKYSVKKK